MISFNLVEVFPDGSVIMELTIGGMPVAQAHIINDNGENIIGELRVDDASDVWEEALLAEYANPTRHYVMREHSGHASQQTLYKVMSRGIKDIRDAESWMRFCKEEQKRDNPRMTHEFFIMTRVEEVEDEVSN